MGEARAHIIEILPPEHRVGADRPPLAPFALPLLVRNHGRAGHYGWVPDVWRHGCTRYVELCEGLALGWTPAPEIDRAVLVVMGGNPAAPSDDHVAATLSREVLRALIADLQSIEAQMGWGTAP